MSGKVNVFYWSKRPNFGDVLADRVMRYYGARNLNNIYKKVIMVTISHL